MITTGHDRFHPHPSQSPFSVASLVDALCPTY